ncbi:MAG: MFS transporter [Deltaproteobacteria bacterium]|nr:MFS transporter [Deltaproteobacteria bacterium]
MRALRSRNYRLFFSGQSISLVGTWMQQVAVAWLMYRLTRSAFFLGATGFASQIPSFFLAPVAGVLADRWDRKRMLLATQALSLLQALVLSILVLTGSVRVWEVLALSVFLGIVNAFDMTVRQTFVVDLVDRREDLGNAIALNSSMVNAARLVGPSVAGLLIAVVGEGFCILLNTLSYVPVLAALAAIRVPPRSLPVRVSSPARALREGFAYTFRFAPLRSIILLLSLTSLVGMPYTVLLPVFAKEILSGGAQTQGFLVAAAGVGALAGSLFLAAREGVLGLGRTTVLATSASGLGLVTLALSTRLWLSLAALTAVGFGMMVQWAAGNTIVQTILEEDKRGRVMSFFSAAFMGVTPIGSLAAGALAGWVGVPAVVFAGGLGCLAGSLWFQWRLPELRTYLRPIYVRMGILPETAAEVGGA